MIKTYLPCSKGKKQTPLKLKNKERSLSAEPTCRAGLLEFLLVESVLCASLLPLARQLLAVSQNLACHCIPAYEENKAQELEASPKATQPVSGRGNSKSQTDSRACTPSLLLCCPKGVIITVEASALIHWSRLSVFSAFFSKNSFTICF
jgi:hypothetical protein